MQGAVEATEALEARPIEHLVLAECERLQDAAERKRCIADSKRSYDDYQRQKAAAPAK